MEGWFYMIGLDWETVFIGYYIVFGNGGWFYMIRLDWDFVFGWLLFMSCGCWYISALWLLVHLSFASGVKEFVILDIIGRDN